MELETIWSKLQHVSLYKCCPMHNQLKASHLTSNVHHSSYIATATNIIVTYKQQAYRHSSSNQTICIV